MGVESFIKYIFLVCLVVYSFWIKCKITFRLLLKQEYFFSGLVKEIIEPTTETIKDKAHETYEGYYGFFNNEYKLQLKLDSGDVLILYPSEIDPLSIHPASYNPIRYFERTPISAELRQSILERDNNTCQIKMEGCTTKAEEIDHIIPISKGGLTTIENLQASCVNCNRKKSNN